MYNKAIKFFALHHQLILPGIGGFSIEKTPAQIDIANRTVKSSQSKILFSNNILQPENRFYNFIAEELNVDEEQAKLKFESFTAQLQQDLNERNIIRFNSIGTLTKQETGDIMFQPEKCPEYLPELSAERIIRKNNVHTVRVGEDEKTSDEMHTALSNQQSYIFKKERWWIAASVLALIGIVMIAFYYITH